MIHKTRKAVKILILTPLVTMVLSLLMLLFVYFSVVFEWNANIFFLMFELLGIFSVTVGLLMTIVGVVLAVKQKSPLFTVIGTVMIVMILVVDSWLYWAAFINESGVKGPPIETIAQQTEDG